MKWLEQFCDDRRHQDLSSIKIWSWRKQYTTQGSNNGSAQNDVQPDASQGYQNAQQDLGNYYFHIYTYCTPGRHISIKICPKIYFDGKTWRFIKNLDLVFTRILYYQYTDSMMGFLIVVGKMAMKRQLLKTINYFNPK